ncbi:hypothetical protein [Demequina soli]|uniref:hypothetical protein n=1 Tax=Demequina soli TaxID=1638987 RepID=UPI000786546B|nr:hypothetical protein [Demequina soli]
MGDTNGRIDAPHRGAAVAGIIISLTLVVTMLVALAMLGRGSGSVEWRDATLPTYPAADWSGDAAPVADGLTAEPTAGGTMCTMAIAVEGSANVGVLVADTWRGTWPVVSGQVSEDPVPRLQHGRDGVILEAPGDGSSAIEVSGRVLDPADPDDAALAQAWTDRCGAAVDAVVQAAPQGLTGGEL